MFKLSDIVLGYADGKNEAEKEWFKDLFYTENNVVDRVIKEPSVFIVSGRKGTGKTILAKYIERISNENGTLSQVIDKEEFFLNYILEKTLKPFTKPELSAFLRYSILIVLTKFLVENEKKVLFDIKVDSNLDKIIKCYLRQRKLKKFYYDVYPKGAFKTSSGEVECSSNGETKSAFLSFGKKHRRKDMLQRKQYFELINELEALVFSVVEYTNFLIFLDDLDELESKIFQTEEAVSVFTELLDTIESINKKLNRKNSKIVILLRSDILEDLNTRSSNSNKMVLDSRVNLNWIKRLGDVSEQPLMDLILAKIQKSCFIKSGKGRTEIYNILFGNNFYVEKKSIVKYLLDNSFGRPRDIITFLNIIIEHYPNSGKFETNMFTDPDCRLEYSRAFTRELKNELALHYNEEKILEMLKLLKMFGRKNFYFSHIETFYKSRMEQFPNIIDLEKTFEAMYKHGIIGNSWLDKGSGKYKHVFAYREDGDADAKFEQKFCVHFALRRELSL